MRVVCKVLLLYCENLTLKFQALHAIEYYNNNNILEILCLDTLLRYHFLRRAFSLKKSWRTSLINKLNWREDFAWSVAYGNTCPIPNFLDTKLLSSKVGSTPTLSHLICFGGLRVFDCNCLNTGWYDGFLWRVLMLVCWNSIINNNMYLFWLTEHKSIDRVISFVFQVFSIQDFEFCRFYQL